MEDINKFTTTRMNRPSYESKISLSLPISNSNLTTTNTNTTSSTTTNTINDIDFSLLDYKSVDDYLYYITTKNEIQNLSKHLAKQLKASRSLLSLSKFLIFGNNPRDLINKIVDSAGAIIDAERVIFLELEQETADLIYFKSQENSPDIIYRIRDGIECKKFFTFLILLFINYILILFFFLILFLYFND